jgi:hypothetical protein
MKTVRSGETPLAVFTIDSLLAQQTRYEDDPFATIVMLIDETRGADAMISWASGVKDIDALNSDQAKIVMVPDSPSEALARVVRAQFNLPNLPIEKDKYMIPITTDGGVDDVYAAFQNAKRTDKKAFVLWEPKVSQAIKEYGKDGAQILIDSSQFKGYIVDVLVVQKEFFREHRNWVLKVVTAYLETLHDVTKVPEALAEKVYADAYIADKDSKMTREQAKQVTQGVWWKNTIDNYGHFGIKAEPLQPLPEMIKNITDVMDKTKQPNEGKQGVKNIDKIWNANVLQELYDGPQLHRGIQTARDDQQVTPRISDSEWATLIRAGAVKIDPIPFTSRNNLDTDAGAGTILYEFAASIKRFPQYYFRVEGDVITTATSDPEASKTLALKRANEVVQYLTKEQNVSPNRLKAEAVVTGKAREVRIVALRKP